MNQIKQTAMTAGFVIESLIALAEKEGIDLLNAKFQVGNEKENYQSPQFALSDLIRLAREGLEEMKQSSEGIVLKTESNTKEYFKLSDWDEWGDIDGVRDAIHSDYDLNAVVPVKKMTVIELEEVECYAHLTLGRSRDTIEFYNSQSEAQAAAEQGHDHDE